MPWKRITRVRFTDAPRPANPPHTSPTSSRTTNRPLSSPSTTRTANPSPIQTPTSLATSLNISTPLTPSLQFPTFDNKVDKIFSKSLTAAFTSKDAVLKEVHDCILTNNESRLKELNPYIHSYWRNLHVRYGCVCIYEKVAIPNVLREALIDDIHASHARTWGMICMALHCCWPYMNCELRVKAMKCNR